MGGVGGMGSSHPVMRMRKIPRGIVRAEAGRNLQEILAASRRALFEATKSESLWRQVGSEDVLLGPSPNVNGAALKGDYVTALRLGAEEVETVAAFVENYDKSSRKLSIRDTETEELSEIPLDDLRDIHVMEQQPIYNPTGTRELDSLPIRNRKAYVNADVPRLLAEALNEFDSRIDRTIWEPAGNESKTGATEVRSAGSLMGRTVTGVFVDESGAFPVVRIFGGTVREVKEVGSRHRLRVNGPYGGLLVTVPGASKLHVLRPYSKKATTQAEPPYRVGSYGAPTPELLESVRKAVRARRDTEWWQDADPAVHESYVDREVFGIATDADGVRVLRVFSGFVEDARPSSSPGFFTVRVNEGDGIREYTFGATSVFELSVRASR
jgi:hypothetical protein